MPFLPSCSFQSSRKILNNKQKIKQQYKIYTYKLFPERKQTGQGGINREKYVRLGSQEKQVEGRNANGKMQLMVHRLRATMLSQQRADVREPVGDKELRERQAVCLESDLGGDCRPGSGDAGFCGQAGSL